MKSKNTNGFTLVELIIVITILAILATIAFISFQGYSAEARDSGKMSEVSEITKAIAIAEARTPGFDLSQLTSGLTSATLSGVTATGGSLKLDSLNMNSKNKYAYIYSASGTYIIAALMEKADTSTSGVFATGSSNYFITGNVFINNGIGTINGAGWGIIEGNATKN